MEYAYKLMASPAGLLKLVAKGDHLAAILWEDDDALRVRLGEMVEDEDRPVLIETEHQLREYFAGERESFDIPLHFEGTEFQRQVWSALLDIPYGQTRTYLDIARQLGNDKAVRAVGLPMAAIPFPSSRPAIASSAPAAN